MFHALHTYLSLTMGLMTDGHVMCLFLGLWMVVCPLVLAYAAGHMALIEVMRTNTGMRMVAVTLVRLPMWAGDALSALCPERIKAAHRREAERAAHWLDGVDDEILRECRSTAVRARFVLALPWV